MVGLRGGGLRDWGLRGGKEEEEWEERKGGLDGNTKPGRFFLMYFVWK